MKQKTLFVAATAAEAKAAAGAPMSPALIDVIAERRRQIEAEGWTESHDDEHSEGQLARAALNYAAAASVATALDATNYGTKPPLDGFGYAIEWPWNPQWWKPGGVRRMLVKAAALIVAEIERLDRKAARS